MSTKTKIYKIEVNEEKNNKRDSVQFIVGIVVYAFVLMFASYLFNGLYIENFWYALLASVIINILNYFVKPLIIYLTLPLTVMSLGICYPVVNIIILKLCSLVLGSHFMFPGFIIPFFIAIFISIMKIILDNIITKRVGRRI